MKTSKSGTHRILAVASGGGHWIQLLRLRPAFSGLNVSYASVGSSGRADIDPAPYFSIPDANRSQKLRLLVLTARLAWILLRVRPHSIVTTGAAPGYLAIRLGKVMGARTLFLDSMANAERLSLSANLAERHADLLLTQWPHLAKLPGPQFRGSVINQTPV